MRRSTARGSLAGMLVTALCGGLVYLYPASSVQAQAASPTPAPAGQAVELSLAVVDYKQLLKNHPDYDKLQQMDEHIHDLEAEKTFLPYKQREAAKVQARRKMEAEFARARGELEAEKAAVESQLRGLSHALQGQMEAEVNRLKAEADRKLRDKFKNQQPTSPGSGPGSAPVAPPDTGGQSAKQYYENLALLRERSLMARKLELEKAMSSAVEAERGRLDQKLAAYEDQVRGQHQEELVNLNLKLRLAKDEEEQKKVEEQVRAVQSIIDQAKASKRTECDAEFKTFYQAERSKFEGELASYQKRVDGEVRAKLGQPPEPKRPSRPPQPNQPNQPNQPSQPPEVTAEVKKVQAQIQGELSATQAQLKARMEASQAEATRRLQSKQAEIQARLKLVQEQLVRAVNDRDKFMDKETKAKMAKLEDDLKKAKEERKQLFKSMAEQINAAVGKVAEKKSIAMVIGEAYCNRDLLDLTDLAMVSVKQLGSK